MPMLRSIASISHPQSVVDGAGVHIKRMFGFGKENLFDPFLLLDNFGGDKPEEYLAGFPWHPHRGIETITYMLEGDVEHGDSIGNQGWIHPGDVQWMTAGSGIIHQEMPKGNAEGRMSGFQLWANLPSSEKMMEPRYRDIRSQDIPIVEIPQGMIRIICGSVGNTSGPVQDIVISPEYLDVTLHPNQQWSHPTTPGHTAFVLLFRGGARFSEETDILQAGEGLIVRLSDGEQVVITSGGNGARFLLISGKPLKEPVAWGGPIVMNTRDELQTAFTELRLGTFIKPNSQALQG